MKKTIAICVLLAAAAVVGLAQEQGQRRNRLFGRRPPAAQRQQQDAPQVSGGDSQPATTSDIGSRDIQFNGTLDELLDFYSRMKKKTILRDPAVTGTTTITFKSPDGQTLTEEDKLLAIETVLEMNQVHLEPYGESFLRALPRKDVRKEGIPLIMDTEAKLSGSTRVVSMMIAFKNIGTEEAQKALEGFKSNSGILLVFERTNSILVTDTEQNINRMLEIAKAIDIASPVGEVVEYIQIKYANANDVKQVIDSIVQESQKEQEKNGKAPVANTRQPPQPQRQFGGLLNRNRQQPAAPAAPVNNESLIMSVSDADRGMIRGKVVTIADERSNKILIITNKENMKFFKDVIEALDVETTPDTVVKVYRLKYAEAEDVSDMINDLIGNSSSSKGSGKQNQNQNAKKGTSGSVTRGSQTQAKKPVNQRSGETKAGELSKDNTTVLADKRINGLVVMTDKDLVPTIEQIIEAMDVKLDQVLIETVIIEVGLNDEFSTGIDWVKGMQAKNGIYQQALAGGGGSATPISGGSSSSGSGEGESGTAPSGGGAAIIDGAEKVLPTIFAPGGAGLSYAMFSKRFDLGAVINASKSDSNSKYLASPIVMTVDNKEATINATRMKYLLKGFQSSGNSYSTIAVPDYEQKELGIEIKVTPKINPSGTVMLTVEEKYTQIGSEQPIKYSAGNGTDGAGALQTVNVPTTITREMSADVILENSQTVVFGGLTETTLSESEAGIPFLKDIPVVGKYLFGKTTTQEDRSELLVFMTPYVIKDGNEAQAEALRRKSVLSDARPWQDRGWSKSQLADPIPVKEQLRRQKEEWKKLDEEHKTELELERSKKDRVRELKRRAKKEAEQRKAESEEEAKERAKEIEENVREFNAQEDKRAEERAAADEEARKNNPLLKQLHEMNGISEAK